MRNGYKKTEMGVIPLDWEVVRLGDIATFYKGKGISKNDVSNRGIDCIRYGELYTKYQEEITKIFSKTNLSKEKLFLSKKNDILIPASGETAIDLATASCVSKNGVALGGDINIIRTELNGIFLAHYLNTVLKNKIASLAQGSSVIHLYSSQLKNLNIAYPPLTQQKKIAKILSTTDNKIEAITKQIEKAEMVKKGLMQRLLNQTEKNTFLKEILTIKYGKNQKSVEDKNGKYPILGTGGLMAYANSYLYDKPSVLIGRKGTIDKPQYMDTPFWTVDTLFYTEIKENTFPKWLFYIFQIIDWKRHNEASGVPSLSLTNIHNIKVAHPPLTQQKKIATILTKADQKIEILKAKKEQYKILKTGLMQKLLTGEIGV